MRLNRGFKVAICLAALASLSGLVLAGVLSLRKAGAEARSARAATLSGLDGPSERGGPDLVILSPHPTELIRLVVDEYRERSGLSVIVRTGGTGSLLERLRQGEEADLFWGGGVETLVANLDLFEPYRSPEREAVPETLRDAEGYWTGFSVLPMVILVNARLVPREAWPDGWRGLSDPRFTGSVAFADPERSGSAYTALRTMLLAARTTGEADEGWAFIDRFARVLEGRTLSESAAVYAGVASGEYLLGASYEYAAGASLRLGGDVSVIYPAEGSSAVPDGVAIVKGAPRREAAEAFVDFVLSRDVALAMSVRLSRRSTRGDVAAPAGMPPLGTLRLIDYGFDAAVAERAATLERFTRSLEAAGR